MNTNTQTTANVSLHTIYESARALESTVANAIDRYRNAGSDLERIAAFRAAINNAGRYPSLERPLKSMWASVTAGAPRKAIADLTKGERFLSGRHIHEMRGRTTGCNIITQHGPLHFDQQAVVFYEACEPTPSEPDKKRAKAMLDMSVANRAVRKARKTIQSCRWSGGTVPPSLTAQLEDALAAREVARAQAAEFEARQIVQGQLEAAVQEREAVADQLVWAHRSRRPEAQIQQVEERLDGKRRVVRELMEELREADRAQLADADEAFAARHPDIVFAEVLQAGGSLELLKKRADQLERALRNREDMPTEREWRAVRAAIHMVRTAPEWCEARQDDSEAIERFEHSAATFVREPVRVGLMSLAEVA